MKFMKECSITWAIETHLLLWGPTTGMISSWCYHVATSLCCSIRFIWACDVVTNFLFINISQANVSPACCFRVVANFRIKKIKIDRVLTSEWPITHMDENYPLIRKSQIILTAHPSALHGIKLCRRLCLIIKERFESSSGIAFVKAMEY